MHLLTTTKDAGRAGATIGRMRTTLDIPADLLDEARDRLGFKSKTDTVILALRDLVRRQRIKELKSLMGEIRLEVELDESRRRPQ